MTIKVLTELTEKRQRIWNEAQAILDTASNEGRDLNAQEQERFDAASGDLTELRSRIDAIAQVDADNRAAEEALRKLGTSPAHEPEAGSISEQFRQLARGEIRKIELAASQEPWKRALTKGTATAGGNTVPTSFHDQLVEHMVEAAGVITAGATVLTTAGGEPIEIPVTTSHGAAAAVAENGTLAGTDPAFAKRTLGAYKYGQLVLVSKELVEDSAVDLEGYLAKVMGRNVGLALGTDIAVGNGSSKPTGIMTTASTGTTGAASAAGVFTADNLIDLMFSVIAPYRNAPDAGWLMKDATLGAVRKLKDGANRYLFEPAATVGAPDTLLGKPITTDPNIAAVAATAASVGFGDFSAYYVRMARGVTFERSDQFAFDSDQIAYRVTVRADGLLVDQTGAFKKFVGGAA
ncbi:phage major capsid protein [Demequina gelatinilytica]|uniref:phage major capsid protein n=1 Tax=Demequina gelatinilytica TaxID=1638980 RepID=UPI000783EFD9|nr:phage major capsid protein [Demequina gelatinilytica]